MADAPVVHIAENSPEYVAFRLLREVRIVEGQARKDYSRDEFLDLYTECLQAVQGLRHK